MINWAEADFTDILLSGSVASFVVLKMEGEKHGLTIASQLFQEGGWADRGKELRWCLHMEGQDAVHLTVAAYSDIAAVLYN